MSGIRVRQTELRKRDFVFRYKAERGCMDCGERDPIVLQLDHRDPATKVRNGGSVKGRLYTTRWTGLSWEKLEAELAKCDVVCANCHTRRTARQMGWYATPVAVLADTP